MKDQCTPTPWKYVSEYDEAYIDGPEPSQKGMINFYLCDTAVGHANAAFIVRAVNSHDELVATLRHIQDLAEENTHSVQDGYCQIAEWARNEIGKAEGK